MSNFSLLQDEYDMHQIFFEKYIKRSIIEKNYMNDAKFSNWRLSYINYITDVNIFYKKLFNL